MAARVLRFTGVRRRVLLLPALLAAALHLPARPAAADLVQATARPTLGDYHHTRWTLDDGAPPAILAMAQTTDGWLWLGTLDGLYRFDGVRFYRHPLPPGLGLNRNLIRYLHAGPRGELYISQAGEGIAVLQPDGRMQELPPGPARGSMVDAVAVDTDGSVWVVAKGIYRLHAGSWHTVETGPAWSAQDMRSFMLDAQGQLWISRNGSTWRLNRRSGHFEQVLAQGGELLPAPDGRLWLISPDGVLRLMAGGGGVGDPAPARAAESFGTGQFAPDGTLWLLQCPERPCVLPDAARRRETAYRVGPAPGAATQDTVQMSGKSPSMLIVDREGNTWIASENGLDRFRRKRILPTGLAGDGIGYSLASDAGGRVWAAHAESGKLWQLQPERVTEVQPRHPLTLLARDPAGRLLFGGRHGIWRENGGAPQEMPLPPGPDGRPVPRRMLGILDDGKVLWTATVETGLLAWQDGRWHLSQGFNMPSKKIYQSALAGPGRLWLATGDGELFHYDVASKTSRPPLDIRALGMTAAIFPGAELVLSGDNGTGVVRGGHLAMLRAADPDALRNVSGLVTTADGDRWLNGAAGLVHVRAADWQRSIADPALALRYEVFDGLDGYPGRAVFESRRYSAWSADGRTLWLIATGGVVRVDTAHLDRNRVAPVPVILSLATDTAAYRADTPDRAPLRLAPGTERFRVDFTTPSLRMPERVRFEYMLEGVDARWQDAGTQRMTSYTSVKPGDYVFRLRAVNEDGVRSSADAVLKLSVEPMAWQTGWFKLLAALLLAGALALAYRLRVRYLTRRLAERLNVRMAERERIARTLHDTFLQTVQSLLLRVDAIAARLPQDSGVRGALEEVIGQAGSALGEGRAQLQELRSGGNNELEDLLHDIVGQLRAVHAGIVIGLRIDGQRRPIEPEVAVEAAAIAREALHNACIHAQAGQVRALLDYGPGVLALTVADDGRGIDAEVLRTGAARGRWGLVGMRERAQRIGALLSIAEGSEGGTVVKLSIPGGRAYGA
ncbi:sensor histidine kinase [Herbaspirillum sp. SJZ107]|uniref:sensor histidine kinase n=1 Tax=Herbaspirillum sp. SJZ107 TaxID=2572881 RepID=UPI0011520EC2|nr:sensor histidine kinase [Herbaspirillum sp. SJZ107]TQK04725.1 histidine kinase [Herbaspirillum sp. SJZ107]